MKTGLIFPAVHDDLADAMAYVEMFSAMFKALGYEGDGVDLDSGACEGIGKTLETALNKIIRSFGDDLMGIEKGKILQDVIMNTFGYRSKPATDPNEIAGIKTGIKELFGCLDPETGEQMLSELKQMVEGAAN